jgi:hypothetical protein
LCDFKKPTLVNAVSNVLGPSTEIHGPPHAPVEHLVEQNFPSRKSCAYGNSGTDKENTIASLDLIDQFSRYCGSIKCHEDLSPRKSAAALVCR